MNIVETDLRNEFEVGLEYYEKDKIDKLEGMWGTSYGWKRIVITLGEAFKNLRPTAYYIMKQAILRGANIKRDDEVIVTRSDDWKFYKIAWGPPKPKSYFL